MLNKALITPAFSHIRTDLHINTINSLPPSYFSENRQNNIKKGKIVFTIQGKLCSVIFMKRQGQKWKKDIEFIDSFEFLVLRLHITDITNKMILLDKPCQ